MISTQDLQSPFDPTAYTSLNGSQILQLINGISPVASTGMFLITSDMAGVPNVPDAGTTTKWQSYGWIRVSATSVSLYLWNPNAGSDATYLKWQSINLIGIGVGAIQGYQIANNTISANKIQTVDWSQLTGIPSTFTPGGPATGDLTGFYPNPAVGNAVITGAKIAASTITSANIAINTISPTNVTPNGVGLTILRTNTGATGVEWGVPSDIVFDPNVLKATVALGIPRVNAGQTAFEMKTTAQLLAERSFSKTNIALVANQITTQAHGLGATPSELRAVLVCGTINNGYAVGDEVNIDSLIAQDGVQLCPMASVMCNSTNIVVIQCSYSGFLPKIIPKGSGAPANITLADWTITVYARL